MAQHMDQQHMFLTTIEKPATADLIQTPRWPALQTVSLCRTASPVIGLSKFVAGISFALAITFTGAAYAQTEEEAVAEAKPEREPAAITILEPLAIHPRTSLTVLEQLRRNHYLDKQLNDELSGEVLDNYIDMLDGGRYFFTRGDITAFEGYRTALDDALKRGNLEPAFEIFNRYQERVVSSLEFQLDLIDAGIDQLDFTLDDQLFIDREEAAWPASDTDQQALWSKRLKAQVLGLRLGDKDDEEITELLSKRFANRIKNLLKNKSEDAFQAYMNAFASTYDPHTQYFSPRSSENFNINMSLSLEGIGAMLKSEDDYTEVVRLVPAGPADKAGDLQPADRIISVGQGKKGPLIDVIGWRLDDVVELIRGPKGSTVRLEVIAADADADKARVLNITRNTVKLEEQAAQARLLTLNADTDEPTRIGIIEIPAFYADFKAQQQGDPNYRSTTRDTRMLIDQLKAEGIDGLIIDLRGNGGGSLQEADSMTGLFIKAGPTVQVKAARRPANVYTNRNNELSWNGPLAVMVDRLSASASEIFAGAIQDYGRGLIIGNQTFGKGTVQTLIPLSRGQLKLTAAKFYRISGQSTQHQGVLPDVTFPTLIDAEEIGESALDEAMPWDRIKAAPYQPYGELSGLFSALQSRHDERAAENPHFIYYRELLQRSEANSERKFLSLNEATRRNEQVEDDAWRLGVENRLRAAEGKPLAATLDELEELEKAEDEDELAETDGAPANDADTPAIATDAIAAETELPAATLADAQPADSNIRGEQDADIKPVEDDPMVEEAGRVMLDFIDLFGGQRQAPAVAIQPKSDKKSGYAAAQAKDS